MSDTMQEIKNKIHYYLGSDSLSDCWGEIQPLLAAHDAEVAEKAVDEAISEPGKDFLGHPKIIEARKQARADALREAAEFIRNMPNFFGKNYVANKVEGLADTAAQQTKEASPAPEDDPWGVRAPQPSAPNED